MVIICYEPRFQKEVSKVKDELLRLKVKKHILKIRDNPEIGKPMRYARRDTREVYIPPFRLSYIYIKQENKIVFLDLYHKDEQ